MKKSHPIRTLEDLVREPRLLLFRIGEEGGSAKVGITDSVILRLGEEVRFRLSAVWKNREGTLPWRSLHSLHSLDAEEAPSDVSGLPLYLLSLRGSEQYVGPVAVVERSKRGLLCFHPDDARRPAYFFYPWHVVARLGEERITASEEKVVLSGPGFPLPPDGVEPDPVLTTLEDGLHAAG